MNVLDMTLNQLKASLQSYSFGEYGVPFHCHNSQVDYVRVVEPVVMGQTELFILETI